MEPVSSLQLLGPSCYKAYFKDYNLNEYAETNLGNFPTGWDQKFLDEITESKSQVMRTYHEGG